MKHQKHTKLVRPDLGQFGKNEWALLGTNCNAIKKLAFQLTQSLSEHYKVVYVDADHQSSDKEVVHGRSSTTALAFGASMEYTDKITFHRIDLEAQLNSYQFRGLMNEQDVVLVNGNHFKAQRQIVIIDPKKEKSLERKLDRLSDVQLILFTKGVHELPDFFKKHLENWENIPTASLQNETCITAFLQKKLQQQMPLLNGLVLAGGKSTRMGQDKGLLNYYGKAQREYMADLLAPFCQEVFLSCRAEQEASIQSSYPTLVDTFTGLGPFGAILSAFRQQPNRACLVVACDLPLLDKKTLQQLVHQRNASQVATAFHNPATNFPEPLITIWEPKAYLVLLQFLTQGYSCPRKVLINSAIELVEIPDATVLKNVNKPEEMEEVMKLIS